MLSVVGGYGEGLTMRVGRAPRAGETVNGGVLSSSHGGKGSNQAVAAARMGADVTIVTALGDDAQASAAREFWATEGIADRSITVEGSRTMVGFIVVEEGGENRIVIADGALQALTADDIDGAAETLTTSSAVLVSLEIARGAAARALEVASAAGVPTILNPSPADVAVRSLLADVDVLIPNLGELATIVGEPPPSSPAEIDRCCELLRDVFPGTLVLTLGAGGVLVDDGRGRRRMPAFPARTVDTTGAGDAFAGVFAAMWSPGEPVHDAVEAAAAAGALAVEGEEVIPALPHRARVEELVGIEREDSRWSR